MGKYLATILATFFITVISFAQVEIYEPNLIADNKVFGLTISPNGKELFYVKSFGGRDTLQIYQSKKVKGKWLIPELAFFADTNFKQIDPAFSQDGKSVLFNSLTSKESSFDIYITHKTIAGWTKPEKLSDSINTNASEFYATISSNRNIYFTRRIQSNDIYVSYFIGNTYTKALPLSKLINTDKNESNPFISPNEDYLIFFSDRADSFGDTDLYISFNKEGNWSIPLNLGDKVNTTIGEFCPSIDLKNKRFLFSRTQVENGHRIENLYTIPLKELKINRLKKHAKWIK
ncbi:MAG: hypothetical protein ABIP79_05985 [Chitinophagaceae bacterium]